MKDWRRVEKVFAAVLEFEPTERPGHLTRMCGDDRELRREVESLLSAHAEISTAFLEQSLPTADTLVLPNPPTSGQTVGPYRLLDKLGEGGMGVVFLGERSDGAFDRKVAIKVLRRGMEGETALLRFDLERRILASLDHPGIARLLDGGTTPAGAPYVVMERVDGEPIDRHCEQHGLSAEARVDLFLEVAAAVASAHQNLVIHRDIKPSNVLVDQRGQTKLLDFGIAKILDLEKDSPQGDMTRSWHRVLTPNYASPEQLRGERVSVATDVYLLGILLYKLLTGQLPHRVSGHSLVQVEAILTSEQPRPPSRMLREVSEQPSDGKPIPNGVHQIDSDLDHIVLKALRGDPAERYASVTELAYDLQRFRAGLPIQARQGNRRYLIKKFAQRHWRSVTAAGLALAVLLLFAIDRTIQVQRREQALSQVEAALDRSDGLWSFVENLFWQADPRAAKGRELTVAQAVSRGEGKLAQGEKGPAEVEAMIHALFGRIRLDLGQYGEALASLDIARQLFATIADKDESLRVAELRAWGDYALAKLHQLDSVNDDGAEQTIAEAIASARQTYEQSRWLEATEPGLALELSNPLAEVYCLLERWQDAAPLTEEAIRLSRRVRQTRSLPVAQALARRALILKTLEGDLERARGLYDRALEIYLQVEGDVHPEVANLHNQLALVASGLGHGEAALASHRQALEVRRQLYPEGHRTIHESHGHLADELRSQGNLLSAAEHLAAAAEVSHGLHGPTSSWTIKYILRQCEVLIEHGQGARAEALLRAQLTPERRAVRPPGSRLITQAEGLLGAALLAQGKDAGERLLLESLATLRDRPDHYEDAIHWLASQIQDVSSPL